MVRHFLRDDDISAAEQAQIFQLASELKKNRYSTQQLAGPQSVALLFDKPSTRTRASFSVAVSELGGAALALDTTTTQLSRGEPVADTVRAIGRYVAAIVWRTHGQNILTQAAQYSPVPVINALTDEFHPCQTLADLFTIQEQFGQITGRTIVYYGDTSSNTAHSTALGGALAGIHVRLVGPSEFAPDRNVLEKAQHLAAQAGTTVTYTCEVSDSELDADVLVTDTWMSMNIPEHQAAQRAELFRPYQINAELLAKAPSDAVVLHCLPAHRGHEITAEVLESARCLVWKQAENRLHLQKSLLCFLLTI